MIGFAGDFALLETEGQNDQYAKEISHEFSLCYGPRKQNDHFAFGTKAFGIGSINITSA
jgi:hypothetical protein